MKTNLRDSLNTKKNQFSNRLMQTNSSSTTNQRSASSKINYNQKRGISNDRESSTGYINSKYIGNSKNAEAPSGPESKYYT